MDVPQARHLALPFLPGSTECDANAAARPDTQQVFPVLWNKLECQSHKIRWQSVQEARPRVGIEPVE
jgi:hypothetical protein